MTDKPNPGSKEAIDAGCTCPRMDNANGKGIKINGEVCFWYDPNCLVHQSPRDIPTEKMSQSTDEKYFS